MFDQPYQRSIPEFPGLLLRTNDGTQVLTYLAYDDVIEVYQPIIYVVPPVVSESDVVWVGAKLMVEQPTQEYYEACETYLGAQAIALNIAHQIVDDLNARDSSAYGRLWNDGDYSDLGGNAPLPV
jgi:hypothetical protein